MKTQQNRQIKAVFLFIYQNKRLQTFRKKRLRHAVA